VLAKQQSEAAERSQIKALVLEADQRDQAESVVGVLGAPIRGGGRFGGRGGRRFSLYGSARGTGGQQGQQQQQQTRRVGLHFMPGPDGL